MGVAARVEPIRTVFKVRLEDRLNHQQHRHPYDAIFNGRDTQGFQLGVGFRDIKPEHRQGVKRFEFQFLRNLMQQNLGHALLGLDGRNGHAIESARPAFGTDSPQGASRTSRRTTRSYKT
jgi:hypothetical protein